VNLGFCVLLDRSHVSWEQVRRGIMPYKDLEQRKQYHRDYYREYMKTKGRSYRDASSTKREKQVNDWKEDLLLDYKLRRIQKKYGREGLIAFERDNFSCSICGNPNIIILEMHELVKPFVSASNLRTMCANCHTEITILGGTANITPEHWDSHFMRVASFYGRDANCFSRKIGAVIVKKDEFGVPYIVSCGRNGPPIGYPHCDTRNPNSEPICPRQLMGYKSGDGTQHCPAVHAEANAILFAAREGKAVDGGTVYCSCPTPCRDCTLKIIQSGIKEVVVTDIVEYQQDGIKSIDLFNKCGVVLRKIDEQKISDTAFKLGYGEVNSG